MFCSFNEVMKLFKLSCANKKVYSRELLTYLEMFNYDEACDPVMILDINGRDQSKCSLRMALKIIICDY